MKDYGAAFHFNDEAVGFFLDGAFPRTEGLYRYMPFRSPGHLHMHEERRRTGAARCSYRFEGLRISFDVIDCPEYGVLALSSFAETSESLDMIAPSAGATATAELVVTPKDLASALPLNSSDAFPAVFATARMVALMEIASARVLEPYLSAGELSVGVTIEATHSAPTPLGATVTATARYIGRVGKLLEFEIIASDPAGEIGRARHKRAIVDTERLQLSAARRIAPGEK